ncbi:MAG: FmdB family zinc ribbon protein [Burkholderiales bacterium]
MPIYEYRCLSCGHEAEVLQKISDVPLVDCPECGNHGMKKLITAAGFKLKGSGWYATDFKGGSGAKKDQPEKKEPKKDESKVDGEAKTGTTCGSGTCPV